MEDVLYGIVSGSATSLSGRIYPIILPQQPTLPAATYQRLPLGTPIISHSGRSNLFTQMVQFSVYGATYASAREAGRDIRDVLNATGSGNILVSFVENDFDDLEPDTGYYKVIVDARFWFKE